MPTCCIKIWEAVVFWISLRWEACHYYWPDSASNRSFPAWRLHMFQLVKKSLPQLKQPWFCARQYSSMNEKKIRKLMEAWNWNTQILANPFSTGNAVTEVCSYHSQERMIYATTEICWYICWYILVVFCLCSVGIAHASHMHRTFVVNQNESRWILHLEQSASWSAEDIGPKNWRTPSYKSARTEGVALEACGFNALEKVAKRLYSQDRPKIGPT